MSIVVAGLKPWWLRFAGLLAVLLTLHSDVGREPRFDPARDSVTMRVYVKPWGGLLRSPAEVDPEWGLDSVTFRTVRGRRFQLPFSLERHWVIPFQFEVVDVRSRDSIWVRSLSGLAPLDESSAASRTAPPETVRVTPTPRWWTTHSMDGGSDVGVRAVTTWPDPRRQRPRTSTVVGRVLDAASEQPWKWQPWMQRLALRPAVVHLAWSRNEAVADSLGYFRLEGVPEGWVKLNAFAIDHAPISRLVHVPADSVTFRLIMGPPDWFALPRWPPPVRVGSVPVPDGPSSTPWREPPVLPGIVGRWRGSLRCVGNPRLPGCRDEPVRYEFTARLEPGGLGRYEVSWIRKPGHVQPQVVRLRRGDGARFWNADDNEANIATRWDLESRGDTLVGQCVVSSTHELLREMRAIRVRTDPLATNRGHGESVNPP
ncbi:MAG TPA: hypothetical protein VI504_07435 [Candidatus Eisenbacteria bacterium]